MSENVDTAEAPEAPVTVAPSAQEVIKDLATQVAQKSIDLAQERATSEALRAEIARLKGEE